MTNLSVNSSASVLSLQTDTAAPLSGKKAKQGDAQSAKLGVGGLAERQIRVGDGEQKQQVNSRLDQAKSFFKTTIKVLAGVTLSPLALAAGTGLMLTRAICQIPRAINEKILEPNSDKRFELANMKIDHLRQPMEGSVLSDAVLDKLNDHAKAMGTKLTPEQIRSFAAAGEHIANALQSLPAGQCQGTISVPVKGSVVTEDGVQTSNQAIEVSVPSGIFSTRALSWYMMACAANQDVQRENAGQSAKINGLNVTDMVQNGSFVMKDPQNKIFDFMKSAPTAASRMSTHFEERVDHQEKHKIIGLLPSSKASQQGIEDYRSLLPGKGANILFDKLKGADGTQELFVKFEGGGCPPYFKKEPHESVGNGIAKFFVAVDRNIHHVTSFLTSRFDTKAGTEVTKRQEHVYKGTMKQDVDKPFADLVKKSIDAGVIDADAKGIAKSVHKFGLPYLTAALAVIKRAADENHDQTLQKQCEDVQKQIDDVNEKLGAVSKDFGIERRGAEAHINLFQS
ncbi:hypothetical protein [Algicola sagamiensis]|uniref:hypothetical protein n=1 Tax=Algicola sagamiensis TaxID=163869 RepID=UPI0003718195|nr:hypothetical protein [Algicola sagamiensis]